MGITPNSNAPFERGLSESLGEGINMNTAFTNFLEIVIISIVNSNPLEKDTEQRKKREAKYFRLIETRKDKTIPVNMLSDLVNLMEEHHEEKKDIIGEMYEKFICIGEHGQFFTPSHIADFMSKIAEVEDVEIGKSVCDVACGSGKLLLGALKNNSHIRLNGFDIDRRCVMMSLLNCYFYGGSGMFIVGNTLTEEYEEGRVCAMGMIYEISAEEIKEFRFRPEIPKSEDLKSYEVQGAIQESLF